MNKNKTIILYKSTMKKKFLNFQKIMFNMHMNIYIMMRKMMMRFKIKIKLFPKIIMKMKMIIYKFLSNYYKNLMNQD